jgi:hypothetical protein
LADHLKNGLDHFFWLKCKILFITLFNIKWFSLVAIPKPTKTGFKIAVRPVIMAILVIIVIVVIMVFVVILVIFMKLIKGLMLKKMNKKKL